MKWQPVIGLEIHARLKTRSKIFSGAATDYGAAPNTQACEVDVALPGVLPVLNAEAVRMAIAFGLAVHAEVNSPSVFERKNYFYPDLPKGYQISQFQLPIVSGGRLEIVLADGTQKTIGLTRAHLEEDAGKSMHEGFTGMSGIDLNRAGTPLIEIVSEPEMHSAVEAGAYMKKIHSIVRYLDICDGNMQEGSFRCDANVSLRPSGEDKLGTRTEIKNLNSFRFVEKAIDYEIERQTEVLESGGDVVQETRLFDTQSNETRLMRSKEEANDYRYFPDPDLAPLVLDVSFIEKVRMALPELPDVRQSRLVSEYGLGAEDAARLTSDKDTADYFEACAAQTQAAAKVVANWVNGTLAAALNRDDVAIANSPVAPSALADLLDRIEDGTVSGKIAKEVFEAMWGGSTADAVIKSRGLRQISDTAELEAIARRVIADSPKQAEQYRAGKEKVLGYFVGQVMKETAGKANPAEINRILKRELGG